MRRTAILILALIVPLHSCTLGTWIVGDSDSILARTQPPTYDYSAYFRTFDNPWVGRSREELVATLGSPDAIYEARPKFADYWEADIPASMYIYASGTRSSGHCIDTYVIDEPTSTVIKYYCR
jgi:hypothetical protein